MKMIYGLYNDYDDICRLINLCLIKLKLYSINLFVFNKFYFFN